MVFLMVVTNSSGQCQENLPIHNLQEILTLSSKLILGRDILLPILAIFVLSTFLVGKRF